jgi:hypothetical protein
MLICLVSFVLMYVSCLSTCLIVTELYVMETLPLEKPTLFFSNHFNYLFFHDTWHINLSGANTHIYISGQCAWNVGMAQKAFVCIPSGCLSPMVWKLFCVIGFDSLQKWEVLLTSAKSQCAHSDMVLLGSPESLSSFLMCIWCPQTSVMWFLAAHR